MRRLNVAAVAAATVFLSTTIILSYANAYLPSSTSAFVPISSVRKPSRTHHYPPRILISSARPLLQANVHARQRQSHALSAFQKQQGGIELSIQTAQLLMDPRRHDKLKQNIQRKWPLVPDGILDTCIDLCADGFRSVAPDKLKLALKPGGMEKVRPDIERSFVNVCIEQQIVRDIPILDDEDKKKMLEGIVDLALDNILDDAEELLAAPEVRLQALEEETREVKQLMGPWRLLLYRIRNNPIPVVIAVAASACLVYVKRDDPLVAPALHVGKVVLSASATALTVLWRILYNGLITLTNKVSAMLT